MFVPSPNCAAAAAAAAKAGIVTPDEVLQAFDKLDAYRREIEKTGNRDQAKIEAYAQRIAEQTKIAAAAKKRQAALTIIARKERSALVSDWRQAGMSPPRAFEALWRGAGGKFVGLAKGRVSVMTAKMGAKQVYAGGMMSEIAKERPHIFNMGTDKNFDRAVFTEMTELRDGGAPGSTGNEDAKWLAQTFSKWAELLRTELNRYGAFIGKLDGWAGAQIHDVAKMIKQGKEAWIGYVASKLDVIRTFGEGTTGTEAARILGDIYDTILTGTSGDLAPETGGRTNPANLADSLSKHRVLHFKDADAALAYREQFGYGTTIAGMMSHMVRGAETLGIMKTMSSNPLALMDSMVAEAKVQIRDDPNITDENKRKWSKQLTLQSGALRSAYDIGLGLHSHVGGSETFAGIMGGIRSFQRWGKLGGAAITSIPSDFITQALAAQFRGTGFLRGVGQQFAGYLKGKPKGEQARIAYLTSTAWEGWMMKVMQGQVGLDTPRGIIGKMEELFFRANFLTQATDLARGVNGVNMAAEMGMRSGDAFATLDPRYKHVLGLHGIDETKWEVIRQAAQRIDGKPYVTSDLMRSLDDAAIEPLIRDKLAALNPIDRASQSKRLLDNARRDLEMDVATFFADEGTYAVISPDDATQRYTTWGGLKRGTMGGEAARAVMQFKSTPIAFLQRPVARLLFGARKDVGYLERATHIGTFAAGMFLAGYMAMTAKDVLKGYWPPRDPSDWRTINAALLQSGALGILGDFLFASQQRFGGGALETVAGPSIGSVGSLVDASIDFAHMLASGGEDKFSGAQAFNAVYGWAPFANLFWVAPAIQYLFVNSVREAISPGYLRRQEKDRRRQYQQERLWPAAMGQ